MDMATVLIIMSMLYISVSSFSVAPHLHLSSHQQSSCNHSRSRSRSRMTIGSTTKRTQPTTTSLPSTDDDDKDAMPTPTNFREAEILGLKLMQEGRYSDALAAFNKGLKLPGSRLDVIRTKNVSGPSPVGGAQGGTEGKEVWSLDEFEFQAAYYNMACACAKLGEIDEAVNNLRSAYENGFDNISTMKSDPDLRAVQESEGFKEFMDEINPKKKGLFGLF